MTMVPQVHTPIDDKLMKIFGEGRKGSAAMLLTIVLASNILRFVFLQNDVQ